MIIGLDRWLSVAGHPVGALPWPWVGGYLLPGIPWGLCLGLRLVVTHCQASRGGSALASRVVRFLFAGHPVGGSALAGRVERCASGLTLERPSKAAH